MDLYTKLTTNMEELAGSFDSRMQQYEDNLKKLSSSDKTPIVDLGALSQEFQQFKSLIWKTLTMMKTQLELLVQGLDRQETASRRKVLLIHGIAESSGKDVTEAMLQVLHTQIKLPDISADDISVCHRLGTNVSRVRPVLVRFSSYKVRNLVWNAKTGLKNSGITISEFLTKARHEVFLSARKHFGIRKCWTSDGKIHILVPDNKRKNVETMSELKALFSAYPVAQVQENSNPGSSQDKGKPPTAKAGKVETRSRRPVK